MGFWSKFANVATGGLAGAARGGLGKGGALSLLTGGVVGGGRGRRPADYRTTPEGSAAMGYLQSFSPEDQQNILASLTGNPYGLRDWYQNAQAAGAVPAAVAPAAAQPTYERATLPNWPGMSREGPTSLDLISRDRRWR